MRKYVLELVNLVDLVTSSLTSILNYFYNLLAKIGVDTAENEPLKVVDLVGEENTE